MNSYRMELQSSSEEATDRCRAELSILKQCFMIPFACSFLNIAISPSTVPMLLTTRDTIYGTTPQYINMHEDLSINSSRSPDSYFYPQEDGSLLSLQRSTKKFPPVNEAHLRRPGRAGE